MIHRLLIFAVVSSWLSLQAKAVEIDFVQSAVGFGTIGNTNFSNTPFTITAIGDTANRLAFNTSGTSGFSIQHSSCSITIGSLGTFQFQFATRTFVNNNFKMIGLANFHPLSPTGSTDLFDGLMDNSFATWDMLSSIGPSTGNVFVAFLDNSEPTSGGMLTMTVPGGPMTFSATIVPEPATVVLLVLGGLGLLTCRNRSR